MQYRLAHHQQLLKDSKCLFLVLLSHNCQPHGALPRRATSDMQTDRIGIRRFNQLNKLCNCHSLYLKKGGKIRYVKGEPPTLQLDFETT